jgi:hypothetical protein
MWKDRNCWAKKSEGYERHRSYSCMTLHLKIMLVFHNCCEFFFPSLQYVVQTLSCRSDDNVET